jgi:hypothetical protein
VSAPGSAQQGAAFTVTVSARDAANNLLTGYAGPAEWKDIAGALPGNPSDFAAGVSKTSVTISQPVRGDRVTASSGGVQGTSGAFSVAGAVDHLELSAPSSAPAGTTFTITARARDAAGNLVKGYAGPATWSDSAGQLAPGAPADFSAGVSTTTARVLAPVHNDVITLSSGGVAAQRKINAVGNVDHFDARVPSTVAVGTPFTLTVSARDAAGNVVPDYASAGATHWFPGGFPTDGGLLADFVKGVSKTTITLAAPRHRIQITVENTIESWSISSNSFDVVGPYDHIAASWTHTGGGTDCLATQTGTLRLWTVDSAGNTVRGVDPGTLTIVNGSTGVFPTANPFVNGLSSTTVTYYGGPNLLGSIDVIDANRHRVASVPVC